jgi:hypothetical protein
MKVSLSATGVKKDGYIRMIRAGGSSGIADITWDDDWAKKTGAR